MITLTQRLDHPHPVTASVTLPIDVRVKCRARVVLDYVAGMTDRFAIQEAERLLG